MATAVKVTQKDYFNGLIAYLKGEGDARFSNEEYIEFLEGRIAVLDKKSANRKTKVNEEDEELKSLTLEALTILDTPSTVTDIMREVDFPDGTSNQKVSAILRKLIAEGKVEREKDKKSTLFSLVA